MTLLKCLMVSGALIFCTALNAQEKYFTKSGRISFISKAPLEDIEARNKAALAVIDTKTGAIQFSVLLKGFDFEKALMQEHFNENYVESHKYPKSEFRGTIVNNSKIDYKKPGKYPALVKGKLSLHGVTRDVQTAGFVHVEGNSIRATANFPITLSDYKISIPSVVKDKISKKVAIDVEAVMDPM